MYLDGQGHDNRGDESTKHFPVMKVVMQVTKTPHVPSHESGHASD